MLYMCVCVWVYVYVYIYIYIYIQRRDFLSKLPSPHCYTYCNEFTAGPQYDNVHRPLKSYQLKAR